MIGISFSVCCFIFLIILLVSYFSKERLRTLNNKMFTILLIINIIGIFIDIGGFVSFKYLGVENKINIIISKIYLIYYLTYIFCFMLYIYNVSTKKLNKIFKFAIYIFSIICLIVLVMPIELHFDGIVGYSSGASVNLSYIVGSVMIFHFLHLYCLPHVLLWFKKSNRKSQCSYFQIQL